MSSVLVVVIVGVIIVGVTVLTAGDGPKPATPHDPSHRDAPELDPVLWGAPDSDEAPGEEVPWLEAPGRLQRLRSAALLTLTVVVLGLVAATVLGTVLLLGARALDRALG